jgi:predicted RNase H-like HicB family nuclease
LVNLELQTALTSVGARAIHKSGAMELRNPFRVFENTTIVFPSLIETNPMREYYAVIFKDPDYGSWATFPDIPGCAATAESFEEAPIHAAEVLFDRLADMERNGYPIPEPSVFASIMADPDNRAGSVILIQEASMNMRPAGRH